MHFGSSQVFVPLETQLFEFGMKNHHILDVPTGQKYRICLQFFLILFNTGILLVSLGAVLIVVRFVHTTWKQLLASNPIRAPRGMAHSPCRNLDQRSCARAVPRARLLEAPQSRARHAAARRALTWYRRGEFPRGATCSSGGFLLKRRGFEKGRKVCGCGIPFTSGYPRRDALSRERHQHRGRRAGLRKSRAALPRGRPGRRLGRVLR